MLIRKILLVTSLVLLLTTTSVQNSWAALSSSAQQPLLMNLFGKANETTEEIKGKAQEKLGEIPDYQEERASAKADKSLNNLGEKISEVGKNAQGKNRIGEAAKNVQDVTDSVADNLKGKAQEVQDGVRKNANDLKAKAS